MLNRELAVDGQKVETIAVLGTGNMGPGIAVLFARAGRDVNIWAHSQGGARKALDDCRRIADDLVTHGLLDSAASTVVLERVRVTRKLAQAVGAADFVSESVVEDLSIKRVLLGEVMDLCPAHAVVSSNTSTLLPSCLQAGLPRPECLLVAHFWNPAQLAPLVEVCAGGQTSPRVVASTMELLQAAGKKPVLMRKEILGFIGNRLMHAMNREALSLIEAGVIDAEGIDQVVLASFGPRFANLGPMEYLDSIGLDLIQKIQEYLYADLDATAGQMPIIERRCREHKLGAKTGRGLMDWSAKNGDDAARRRDAEFYRRSVRRRQQRVQNA